jgi:cysteine desulfurase/selenocysteine lyase
MSVVIDLNNVRAEFPVLQDKIFLDAACVSVLPRRAGQAINQFVAELVDPSARDATEHHIRMDALREAAMPQLAAMLDCDRDQLAFVESTTHGLNIAAQAIPWAAGDEVVMCDLEFLQVAIPFVKLAEQVGVNPVFVKHRSGIADADAFAAAVTPRTRAIVVSSTQWTSGYRIDLSGLAEIARSVNAWLVVDGIQQAGAVPIDLAGVDFLVAGGHKWLNSPMGTGFLYLSNRVLDELEPASWGYFALEPPQGGWGNYFSTPDITPDRAYNYVRTARRFEIGGTSNYPGAIALGKSMEIVNQLGIAAAAGHIWNLGDRLIEGLATLDLQLETPFDRSHRAGIIAFTTGQRARDRACLDFLLDRGILVAHRYTAGTGGVRASIHYFNNEDDIDQLLDATRAFVSGRI